MTRAGLHLSFHSPCASVHGFECAGAPPSIFFSLSRNTLMSDFNLDNYRDGQTETRFPNSTVFRRRPLPRHRRGEHFLMGPVPMAWLSAAACLPGKALHVGVFLWHLAGLTGGNGVTFSAERCARFSGCHRTSASRGLEELRRAGLVEVVSGIGRAARVVLLDIRRSALPTDIEKETGVEPRQPAAESGASPASDQSST